MNRSRVRLGGPWGVADVVVLEQPPGPKLGLDLALSIGLDDASEFKIHHVPSLAAVHAETRHVRPPRDDVRGDVMHISPT